MPGRRLPAGRLVFFVLVFFLTALPGRTSADQDLVFQDLAQKAQSAVLKKDKKKADFYIARYLGLSSKDPSGSHGVGDLEEVLQKRGLPPKAFVSGRWNKDFIDWFEKGLYPRWGADEKIVREKARSFEIAGSTFEDKYFVTITACPEIQRWHVMETGLVNRPLILLMGSASDRPIIFFGKIFKGHASIQFNGSFLNVKKRALHYVWKPDFYDLDKDGVPEVWLRYCLAWGNGFSQVMEVYRIRDDSELELLKRFNSDEEGIVRRLPDGRVEVGRASGSQKNLARFDYDRYHFKTLEYQEGDFKEVSEEERPFFPATADWRPYFLEPDPGK